ncbi:50S ribosomal protein L29 [Lysobacter sp. A6]|jgi:large subunit ribosomal protein L29|uniref:Large ribosomal subunit protein uL29 n=1 Tax=Noviluteimonas lactosilytica TaxID=2888523 RepID=A0ABS8JFD7_9GAMM|nr:50S ribosomal protein L29 [Lysobacter lactosilyticus]MCC8362321.1 50S ribosomal protein L29 [Lysobacter lactosilyticus]
MELKELRQKNAAELKAHLVDLQKEQFALRMQKATGQLPPAKTHEARRVRREIARVNMLLGDVAKK